MALHVAILTTFLASTHPLGGDVQQQYERWERRLREKVVALHEVPFSAANSPSCDVTISFEIGANGRPERPTIRNSTCAPFFEKASRRLVARLGTVGPVPSMTGNHPIVLKLSYGSGTTAEAEASISSALEAERRANDRRNLSIVSMPPRAVAANN